MKINHSASLAALIPCLLLACTEPIPADASPPDAAPTAAAVAIRLGAKTAPEKAHGDGASLPDIGVRWEPIKYGRIQTRAASSLAFTVENRGGFARNIEVRLLSPRPDGKPAERVIGLQQIEAGQAGTYAVEISQLPLQTIDASAQVYLYARDAGATGEDKLDIQSEPISVDFSDDLYEFADVYDEQTKADELAGGKRPPEGQTFRGRVWQDEQFFPLEEVIAADRPDAFVPLIPGIWRDIQPEAFEEGLSALQSFSPPPSPQGACAPRSVKFCAKWWAGFNDAGYGEDILNSSSQDAPARYTEYEVTGPDGFIDYGVYLDNDGCTPTYSGRTTFTSTPRCKSRGAMSFV